ncbi:MAG: FHA domain-containing protein [Chthonomonas sp.]|nr:FHA domain-containing protein [Chthonomonas sp.]
MRSPFARAILALSLFLFSFVALAQVKVAFPGVGEWEAWIGPGSPGGKSTFKSKGETVQLPLAGTNNEDLVNAYDGSTGNQASKKLDDIDDVWRVTTGEFKSVASIYVEVTHKGAPVAAANVSLKSKARTQQILLTPSQKGRLNFKNVVAGPIEITVSTSKDGKPVSIPKQVFDLNLTREQKEPVFRIAVAEDVDTVTAAATTKEPTAPKPGEVTTPFFRILQMLLGLGAIAAIVYLVWKFLPGAKPKIDEQLGKLGVQIPEDQPVDPDPPAAPAPAPAPVEQIILDNSAPAPAPVHSISEPTLVGPAGRLEIPEGTSLLTREESDGLYIASTTVSRKHAELIRNQNLIILRDLGSTNGTFVNGERITADTTLKNGDRVQFGDVQFVVEGI